MSEAGLQAQCFRWAWNTYEPLRYRMFHIPNGELRTKMAAVRMQAMGVLSGVWDMLILYNGVHFIEFKSETGTLSKPQKHFQEKQTEVDSWTIVKTFEEFQQAILKILTSTNIK